MQPEKEYVFMRNGVPEKVTPEPYGWGVVYKDGSELKQFGDDGVFHQFQEIVQENVEMFVLYKMDHIEALIGASRFDVPVTPNMQLFYFYRNMQLDMGGPTERFIRVFVFGWKDRTRFMWVEKENQETYLMETVKEYATAYHYVLPDGRIISADHDIHDVASAYEL